MINKCNSTIVKCKTLQAISKSRFYEIVRINYTLDTVINANTFMYLGRDNYDEERMKKIKKIQDKQKAFYLNDSIFEKQAK